MEHTFNYSQICIQANSQIWVHKDHQDYQRILWGPKPDGPVKIYRLKTVTYGCASAPFLAQRCLMQIAQDLEKYKPQLANIIRSDFYMDDLLTGADTAEEAAAIQAEVSKALSDYGFPLRKWTSNESYVIDAIKGMINEPELLINPAEEVKTLGMKWNRQEDTLSFKVSLKEREQITKRMLLSEIMTTFDPLGYVAPAIITARILNQSVWLSGIGWDDPLPQDLMARYQEFRSSLPCLDEIAIPRWVHTLTGSDIALHGFCDASQTAYAAAVYLRVKDQDGNYNSNLLAAKAKVAPLKPITLPRLELLGATLLAKLIHNVKSALRRPDCTSYCWSDSKITIAWIQSHPSQRKTFVANRVAMIQEKTTPEQWRWVPSAENPADVASRGIMPHELKDHKLWFHGPLWLLGEAIPQSENVEPTMEEMKKVKVHHVQVEEDFTKKFSSYHHLIRCTARILRLRENYKLKKRGEPVLSGPISAKERLQAFHAICAYLQRHYFPKEHKILSVLKSEEETEPQIHTDKSFRKSKMNALDPFVDHSCNVIRVGGRLRASTDLSFEQKHPIILPDCHFVRLYLQNTHHNLLHAGPTQLLAVARDKIWIIRGRHAAQQVVRRCHTCTRWKGETLGQKMGDLPAARIQGQFAFQTVGVDFAGPFSLKSRKGRGSTTEKGWICLFVCFLTKAVHVELVSDLRTETFLAAFRRFVSRRGNPAHIYSDNGTTFVAAKKELHLLLSQEQSQQEIINAAADQWIEWHFIPPYSPHWGGLWEAGVKSVKYHLKRVLGESYLTYEEMNTTLVQIEGCLNSRPLCPLTEDPTNTDVLTPGHFLIGRSIVAAPDPDLSHLSENRLSRWQYCQLLLQSFWKRWTKEYLSELQQRYKWKDDKEDAYVGQLVLIKDDNAPPTKWKRGLIEKVSLGDDGKVRAATVRTAHGEAKRPVVKLVPLYVERSDLSTGGSMLGMTQVDDGQHKKVDM